jgi:membrane dipeptidase
MGGGERHLPDRLIGAIAQRGGVVGLNLYGSFLVPKSAGRRATVADAVAHVEHACAVAGTRAVAALGSDMDGGFDASSLPDGLDHPKKLRALPEALRAAGWSARDVAGFTSANWLRVLRLALPSMP